MRFVLIVDAYPPFKSSAALQMRDLAEEFSLSGHQVFIFTPDRANLSGWSLNSELGVSVLRLGALKTKTNNLFQRAFAELTLPFFMFLNFRKSPIGNLKFDGIVWYSPTIFFGLFIKYLKYKNKCKAYLILRDIFPDIAVDLGILKKGFVYRFFKNIEFFQYSLADKIGVQSEANILYLKDWALQKKISLEVLNNWQTNRAIKKIPHLKVNPLLNDKKIIIYAGNIGVMQGFDLVFRLGECLTSNEDWVILLIGRGTEATRLKQEVDRLHIKNVIFHDAIETEEIPDLLLQCDIGLILLDPRLKTHNIPGKLISYMRAGLPTLAHINAGNDLSFLISENKIGLVTEGTNTEMFLNNAKDLINNEDLRLQFGENAAKRVDDLFGTKTAYKKIYSALV
jgi:glycosyltransferase involved in cell wall biosynthesis